METPVRFLLCFCICVFFVFSCCQPAAGDCSTVTASLSGCISYLQSSTGSVNATTCCKPLTSVLASKDDIQCLCALATSSGTSADIQARALTLPKACNLTTTFSASSCSASTGTNSTSSPSGKSSGVSLSALGPAFVAVSFAYSVISVASLLL